MPFKDKESAREWKRRWYESNREHALAYQREYDAANYERLRERKLEDSRRWRLANPERVREIKRAYRARKKAARAQA